MDKRESLPGIALRLSLFIITIVSSIGVMMSNETQQKVKFHIYENFFSQAYLDLLSLEVIGKEYLKPEQNRLQIALASSSESIENSLSFETENGRVFGNFMTGTIVLMLILWFQRSIILKIELVESIHSY